MDDDFQLRRLDNAKPLRATNEFVLPKDKRSKIKTNK